MPISSRLCIIYFPYTLLALFGETQKPAKSDVNIFLLRPPLSFFFVLFLSLFHWVTLFVTWWWPHARYNHLCVWSRIWRSCTLYLIRSWEAGLCSLLCNAVRFLWISFLPPSHSLALACSFSLAMCIIPWFSRLAYSDFFARKEKRPKPTKKVISIFKPFVSKCQLPWVRVSIEEKTRPNDRNCKNFLRHLNKKLKNWKMNKNSEILTAMIVRRLLNRLLPVK